MKFNIKKKEKMKNNLNYGLAMAKLCVKFRYELRKLGNEVIVVYINNNRGTGKLGIEIRYLNKS